MGTQSAEAEFDAFYRDTARRVVHLVYGFTGDLTVAQDSHPGGVRAGLAAVVHRPHPRRPPRLGAHGRPAGGHLRVAQEDAPRTAPTSGTGPTTRPGPPTEDRVAVVAALRTLSEPLREAVTLHYIGDLSIDQIAHETNTPAGTVKARLHRGRAQLAQALRHEETSHG